ATSITTRVSGSAETRSTFTRSILPAAPTGPRRIPVGCGPTGASGRPGRHRVRPLREQLAAEFVGVFVFVFIGAGASTLAAANGAGTLGVAVAHGLALGIMVSALGH